MNLRPVEVVGDDPNAPDNVTAWLALGCVAVRESQGEELFDLGVPCRRIESQAARKRYTYKNGGTALDAETGWDDHFDAGIVLETVPQEDLHEEVVVPASYSYETPEVFAHLSPRGARWCYEKYEASELGATFKLHGAAGWFEYVQELREKDGDYRE